MPEQRRVDPARKVDDIGDHSGGRRSLARAAPAHHDLVDRISLHHHGVEAILDRGNGVAQRHHHRRHVLAHARPNDARLGHAQQLEREAEFGRHFNVFERHVADPAQVDGAEVRHAAKGNGGQDGELVRRIHTVDVEGGVRLGVAQRLRLGQHVVEGPALGPHLGQDEVTGAVEDARDRLHPVGGQPFAQAFNRRDTARDRRLEIQRAAVLSGQRGQLGPTFGDQRLVGRDHRLARPQRGHDRVGARAAGAADHLDQHVDVIAHGQRSRISLEGQRRQIDAPVARGIARRDRRDPQRPAGARADLCVILGEQAQHAYPDRAQPGNPDPLLSAP